MRRDEASLQDILFAARQIIEFLGQATRQEFDADLKLQAALERKLEIIGEATKRLSREFRNSRPGIPWDDMAGMRDVIIHAYDRVDPDELWNACHGSIPDLLARLEGAPKG